VVVGALAENCRSLKKITLTTCKLTAAAVRRLFCKCRGLRSTVETLEWSAEHTLAAEECAAHLDCISLHDALLGNVATDTSLLPTYSTCAWDATSSFQRVPQPLCHACVLYRQLSSTLRTLMTQER
jgi:hypothetical protein